MEQNSVRAARTLITLSVMYQELADGGRAVSAAEEALELLDPEHEPRLHVYAQHSRVHGLCLQRYYAEAREAMAESAPLYERYLDSISQLRVALVEGKIARGLGETEAAESHFLAARHGFLKEEMAFDAALVSLELAGLYLEAGRTGEVRRLAEEMVEVFTRLEIHREATTALLLFADAAQLERITAASLEQLATYLTRARRDPALPFQDAS